MKHSTESGFPTHPTVRTNHIGYRGTGLGMRLTEERIGWARKQRLEALYLLTTTAAPFFGRLGFVEVARASAPAAVQTSREFATACPAGATCMRLPLAGA